jgi:peptide chain release factor 1
VKLPEDRLNEITTRFQEVEKALGNPQLGSDPNELKRLGKEHAELRHIVEAWREYQRSTADLEEAKRMLATAGDEKELVQSEIEEQQANLERLEKQLAEALIPKDPNDDRDVIVEIRAGAGGDEAGLFAASLYRMYTRYAENKKWKVEELSANESGIGGYKEVIFSVKGKGAYARLKYEGGVHRVQRVPVTESSGRIHTSTVGVLVLPEAEEVDVEIDPNDLRIDVYRSSGPGGQSVNTTDSAVRIKHIPTGVEVACQDEKSQLQNKDKALRILRSRLLQLKIEEQQKEQAEARRSQVRSADRSERIRTYNFAENRVTDHRIGYTVHRLAEILEGDLDDLIDALVVSTRDEQLGDSAA